MITDPVILHSIREFVKSSFYPLIFEHLREKFIHKMLATDQISGYEERDHWFRMITCVNELDKELRVIADSAKFRS